MAKSVSDYQTAFQNFMEKGARYYACPTGTMLPFAGKTVPAGFLLCNGAEISRTTYARLFSVLGTTWGAGNGSTTFNLPNVNDRCLEGTTNTANVGKYLEAGLPDITGTYTSYWNTSVRGFNALEAKGCFYADIDETKPGRVVCEDEHGDNTKMNGWPAFKSSGSQSVYGKSSSVQPNSFHALIIVKI